MTKPLSLPRSAVPRWVRESPSTELHAIATRFLNSQESVDLTERQEWLWSRLVAELEWRWLHTRPVWQRCPCGLCRPPF